MASREQIPILLLTGFLGAGKSTLLAHWLKSPELSGAMVIVNEFGEVGLDHRLLVASSEAPILLENGCACCEAQEDLVDTLDRLFWDRLHKRTSRFEWVLIETTGMADPLPVMAAIRRHALVGAQYRIAGVVTAVDARRGLERLAEFPECRNQLAAAQVVVVTKTDIASAAEVEACVRELASAAPQAHVLASANGGLAAAAVLKELAACSECGSHAHEAGHHHAHDQHDHAHDGEGGHTIEAEHASGVTNAFLPLPKPVSWPALIAALDTLLEGHGDTLLRLKGLVRLEGAPGYHAVQATPGQGITRSEVPIEESEHPRTGFTLIVFHEPAAGLASSLLALIAVKSGRAVGRAASGSGAA